MSVDDVIAVIIGRAGSRGLPGKNALPLAGRPMIGHAIEAAQRAATVDTVIVSTDGDAIAAAAEAMDVPVVRRPAELASDAAAIDGGVRHAIECVDAPGTFGVVVILYANVPVRPDDLIDLAVRTLRETGADSVQSYAPVGKHHPWWMVQLDDTGRVTPHHESRVYRRQDLPPLLIPDGGVIAVTRKSLFTIDPERPDAFLGRDRRGIETPPGAVVDVDDAIDLRVAEAVLTQRLQELPG